MGFTLLEILIGTTLLGVMMLLLFSSIRMGARVWDAGESRASEVDQVLIIQSFLRDQLTRSRPVFDDFTEDETEFSFSGTEDSLEFVSMLPSSAGRGGMHFYKLKVDKKNGVKHLMLELKPFYPVLEGEESKIEDVRLLSDVEAIELSYFGVDPDFGDEDDEDEWQWYDEWKDRDAMPQLVKLVVVMQDEKRWPPLVVRPRIVSADIVN
jgi:general secretion pathway protein J